MCISTEDYADERFVTCLNSSGSIKQNLNEQAHSLNLRFDAGHTIAIETSTIISVTDGECGCLEVDLHTPRGTRLRLFVSDTESVVTRAQVIPEPTDLPPEVNGIELVLRAIASNPADHDIERTAFRALITATPMRDRLTLEELANVAEAIRRGRTIAAVKVLHEHFCLKDCVLLADALQFCLLGA